MIKRIVAYKDNDFNIADNLEKFITQMQEVLTSIPEENRSQACIDFDIWEEYGSPYLQLEVSYPRQETPQEEADRLSESAARREVKEKRDREMYAELKKKFG